MCEAFCCGWEVDSLLVHLIIGRAVGGLTVRRSPPDVGLRTILAHHTLVPRTPPCLCACHSEKFIPDPAVFDRHHAALQSVNMFMRGTDGLSEEMHPCMQTLPGWVASAWNGSIHDKESSEAASGQNLKGSPGRRWPRCECRPRTEGPVGQHTHFISVDRL